MEKSFLGTGWGFPPQFDKEQKGVAMVSDTEDIEQSLNILLNTSLGERVMQPKYGSNLQGFIFEPAGPTLVTTITDIVRTAIIYFETRIELLKLKIDTDRAWEGILLIKIDYRVKITNSRFNYVFPFYTKEGTDINMFPG
jgi:phage baseplate assembly protein W